jgi:Cu+-exporting ATPase
MIPDILLSIDGMMCQNNCGTTVHNSLQSVLGVQSVQVSFPSALATVKVVENCGSTHDVLVDELIEAVENVGFVACLLENSKPSHVLTVLGMMCQKNCGTTVQRALSAVSVQCGVMDHMCVV